MTETSRLHYNSSPETTELILQTLLTFVSQVQGASELLRTDDLTPLTEIAVQHPLVLDILGFTWINTSTIVPHTVLESIDRVIPSLIIIFRDTDAVTFIKFLGSLLPKLVPQVKPQLPGFEAPSSCIPGSFFKPEMAWLSCCASTQSSTEETDPGRPSRLYTTGSRPSPNIPLYLSSLVIQR